MKTSSYAGLLVCVGWMAGEVLADDNSDGGTHLAIGPGTYLTSSYPGARSTRSLLVPFIDAQYENRFYSNAADVFGVYARNDASVQTGAAFVYDLTEREAKDDQRFRELHDIKETVRLKLFASRTISFVTGDANVSTDVEGRGEGTIAQANVWFTLPLLPKAVLSAGPGLTWADSHYMRTFFSITSAQAAVTSLTAYSTHEGVVDMHWNVLATYEISSRWSLGLAEYLSRLHGSADDSPVTQSRRQIDSLVWLAYKLK